MSVMLLMQLRRKDKHKMDSTQIIQGKDVVMLSIIMQIDYLFPYI